MTATSQPTTSHRVPWLAIWIMPRKTIRQIVDADPDRHVAILAVLSGVARALDIAAKQMLGDMMSLKDMLIICVIGGIVGGVLWLWLRGELYRWTGSWFGGKATAREVRAAVAWSSIPDVVMLLTFILIIAFFGHDWFTSSSYWVYNPFALHLILGLAILGATLLVWRMVLFIKCLSEVHRFSSWRGLVSSIPAALIEIIIAIIML